jgi:hypothetical protein
MRELTRTSLTKRIRATLDAPSDRLDDLVRASGINPRSDLRFGDWRELDLTNADLRGFDFSGADLSGTKFDGARVAGAIFDGARYELASLYKAQDVICFTPNGRLIALQPKATAKDFAKALQREGLNGASAVKINGKTVAVTSTLMNGDRVEIVASNAKPANRQSSSSFRVGRSRSGLGLFATEKIKKGTPIVEFTGPLHANESDELVENKYLFEVNSRWTIDGSDRSNLARYVNHSCRPNAESHIRNRRVKIRALKNIKPGDEITYDCGKDYFNAYIKPVGCKCIKCLQKQSEKRKELRAASVSKRGRRELRATQQDRPARSSIEEQRKRLVKALARREQVEFINISKALYRSANDDVYAACTLSKRYERKCPQYWYGYSRQWHEILSQHLDSFLILGCIDRKVAFAIPNAEITKVLGQLYRTPDRHWHIVLEEDQANRFNLVTRKGVKVPINKFKLSLRGLGSR